MADRTVRAIFEAKVDAAKSSVKGYASELKDADKLTTMLQKSMDRLGKAKVKPEIDVKIADAEKKVKDLTGQLESLAKQDATPEVRADISKAEKNLATAEADLKALQGAKAEMILTADTSGAEDALAGVEDTAAQVGSDSGDEMGRNLVSAFAAIPIAGAVVGLGAALAAGLMVAIKDGLAIEAGRDLFSARTGLDEATANRFGRAAGEAYAGAWGESVEANLETARVAMEQGLLDPDATQAQVEEVITSLSGITDIMQVDIPGAARAAGQLVKTGLVDNAQEAFDVLVAGYQNGANASDDFIDTLTEYPTHFRDLGLSAQEATGLLIQGMDGGAFNADKVADSLKELTIRVKDLSAEDALTELGLDAQGMADAFAQGGPAAHDALGQILTGLQGIEDPSERSRLAVELFGTQAEDMAAALGNLDLSTAVDEIGGVEGSAGAAATALQTLSDNGAAQMESAQRNIEVAADGIKGALAAAFGDEIEGFATWVQGNRAAVMEFLAAIMNGAFDAAGGFVDLAASATDGLGQIIAGLGDAVLALDALVPGDQHGEAFQEWAYGVRGEMTETADTMRTEWGGAIDAAQERANAWLGPEIMSARVHDATVAMSADMDAFSAYVDASGGTVTINGDSLTAEQTLDLLTSNINGSDGTVIINGDRVPADRALAAVEAAINSGSGTVTIGARDGTANTLNAALGRINRSTATVNIRAVDNATATARAIAAAISRTSASIKIYGQRMLHDGGTVPGPGGSSLASGWVPGARASYDNVQWPTTIQGPQPLPGRVSGGYLSQPLSGGEYVVNAQSAAANAALLQTINATRGTLTPRTTAPLSLDGAPITAIFPGLGAIQGVIRQEIVSDNRKAKVAS